MREKQQKIVNAVRDEGLPGLAAYVAGRFAANVEPEIIAAWFERAADAIRKEIKR